jgi:hypothetical protein
MKKWLCATAGACFTQSKEETVRYLVTARVKPGREADLLRAIEEGSLGAGSVAGDEYLRNMQEARLYDNGRVRWVEICFCPSPLLEEQSYWEEYFELVRIQDAHGRHRCRDLNGTEPWACCSCDCTERLEARLSLQGCSFLDVLRAAARPQPQRASELLTRR